MLYPNAFSYEISIHIGRWSDGKDPNGKYPPFLIIIVDDVKMPSMGVLPLWCVACASSSLPYVIISFSPSGLIMFLMCLCLMSSLQSTINTI